MSDGLFISGDRRRSRSEIEDRSLRAAEGFRQLGVQVGEPVALMLRNDFAFIEAAFAIEALGGCAVPVNWHLAPPEVAYVIRDCGARVVVVHADLLHLLGTAVPDHVSILVVETPPEIKTAYGLESAQCAVPDRARIWDNWLQQFEPLRERNRQFTDSMIYTSGTTGKPKGVRRFPLAPETAGRFLALRDRIYGVEAGITALVCGPMYHGAPNSFGMRAARLAQTVILMPRFDALHFMELVEKHRVTNAFMVPTMFVRLLKLPESARQRHDLTSLAHLVTAAAPCPVEVKAAMIEWLGPIIHEFYAATELSYMTACTAEESLSHPGTVGRALEGVTLEILDAEGQALPAGETGQIFGHLAGSPEFTYHNRQADRAAVERNGLITGGDVGYLDDEGYLYLCDRQRDLVISGGVNIYPAEIEAVLLQMPGVRDSAVYGVPDGEFGEKLMASVEPEPGAAPSVEAITDFLRERLAGFKVPRVIELRDSLPRDDSGKIYKRRLRDPHWDRAGRQI